MADHDIFVKHNDETNAFEPKRLEARFYDRGTLRVKFDDSEQYWREFVNKWWHHDGLTFRVVELSADQQARLDAVNANNVDVRFLSEVADYVQHGAVSTETTEPYLATLVGNPDVEEARLEKRRVELRQRLAEHRYAQEIAGTALADGTPVETTRQAQAQLTTVHQTLKEGFKSQVDYKSADGWVTVTLSEIAPVVQAAADHVQTAFSAERAVSDLIDAAAEADLEAFDVVATYDAELAAL